MHHDMEMGRASGGGLLQWLAGYGYAPHSGCFLGDNAWVAAYVAANWAVALAYILIALLIAQRMQRASHIPRTIMGLSLLGIFVTCAGGHFLEGFTTLIWPGYRLETLWHWGTAIPAYLFLANHKRFSLIVEGPHMITETREELARKNSELSALYEQVKHLDELKSQFFANVSHELRTPLALILGPVERMLAEDPLTEAQRHNLKLVARNARAVLKHVNDLLDISKMEAGKMEMRYAETDLARMVRLTAGNFDSVVEERRLTFAVEAPETLMAQLDAEKMQRVLLNLFSNAIKFVPDGGSIRCRLQSDGDRLTLQVQDNGPGVPVEMRSVIFERFRQAEGSATRRFGGTGLGLAIVKDFVELHGGNVSVADATGGGALFTVNMPLSAPIGTLVASEAADVSDEIMQAAWEELRRHAEVTPAPATTDKPLILVVEDNQDMSEFIAETLAGDYRVVLAHDGQEGLERALELRPDLILSDIMMPRKTGDEMVRELRRHQEIDVVPIVLLTAKADDDLRIRLLEQGAQDYLMKPFAAAELRARVGNQVALKRARQVLQDELANSVEDVAILAQALAQRNHVLQAALQQTHAAQELAEASRLREHVRNEQLVQAVREAHHRIKNNLQAVTALLELQIDDAGEQIAIGTVRQGLRQIKAIALVHDLLAQDRPIGEVDVAVVLKRLATLIMAGLQDPRHAPTVRVSAEPVLVPAKVATSLSLIVNELVTNATKYSIAGRAEVAAAETIPILVNLERSEDRFVLSVEDPGPGFPAGFDPRTDSHTGLELVSSLVRSDLGGEMVIGNIADESHDSGSKGRVTILFPPPAAEM